MRDFFVFTTKKTKTRRWRHIYHNIEIPIPKNHDIEIPRPKSHDIKIPRPKNHDIEIWGLKHHDIEKGRQLSHDIVILRHFFRGQKATTSGFQDWKTTTSRFQDQKATTSSFCGILTLMPPNRLQTYGSISLIYHAVLRFKYSKICRKYVNSIKGAPAVYVSESFWEVFEILINSQVIFSNVN